jgi:hypothetical protein
VQLDFELRLLRGENDSDKPTQRFSSSGTALFVFQGPRQLRYLSIASGTSTSSVVATDSNNNIDTNEYEVENLGSSKLRKSSCAAGLERGLLEEQLRSVTSIDKRL